VRVAFLGGGNMARALIGGLLERGIAPGALSAVEINPAARETLSKKYGIHVSTAPDAVMAEAGTWVLAVKPQDMRAALASVAPRASGRLVMSVAAGLPLALLERWLGGHRHIVRAMPNMPALVGAGISGACALPEVTPEERGRAQTILGAVGEVIWLDAERLLDPVTAVSGSGPAYVFWFIEQLAHSGERLGLPADAARQLAMATVLGAAKLAAASDEPPAVLRERVTSRGGTTEAALQVFAEERLAERFAKAVEAASRRATELGARLGDETPGGAGGQ